MSDPETMTLDDYIAAAGRSYMAKLRAKKPRAPRDPSAAAPKKRGNPEQKLQVAIVADIFRHAPSVDVVGYVATAQGSGKTPEERIRYGARMKAFGVKKGEPDLRCDLPDNVTVFLECKSAVGRVSPEQQARHDVLRRKGRFVYVVHSVEEARAALASHGVPFTGALRPALPAQGLHR